MAWIGTLMAKSLNYRRDSAWKDKITEICGKDVRYECVKSEALNDTGEWYLFINDPDWRSHISKIRQCNFVVSVITGEKKEPYIFSNQEVNDFIRSASRKNTVSRQFVQGDAVRVKKGYLSNLYGIVCSVSGKTADVFFSFCIKNFHESIQTENLEFAGHTDFNPGESGKQLTIGAQVVFPNNIHR